MAIKKSQRPVCSKQEGKFCCEHAHPELGVLSVSNEEMFGRSVLVCCWCNGSRTVEHRQKVSGPPGHGPFRVGL
jgi:hypothetical protein